MKKKQVIREAQKILNHIEMKDALNFQCDRFKPTGALLILYDHSTGNISVSEHCLTKLEQVGLIERAKHQILNENPSVYYRQGEEFEGE